MTEAGRTASQARHMPAHGGIATTARGRIFKGAIGASVERRLRLPLVREGAVISRRGVLDTGSFDSVRSTHGTTGFLGSGFDS